MSKMEAMPDGHLTAAQVARYLARRSPAAEVLALHRHAEECAPCRRRLTEAAAGHYAGAAVPVVVAGDDPAHLDEDELAEYLAGRMAAGGRERAARHLAECAACAADAREMQAPGAAALPARRRQWRAALAAAAVLVVGAGGAVWWRLRQPRPAPAPVAVLRDAGVMVRLEADGTLEGIAVPAAEAGWIAEAMRNGRLPLAPPLAASPRTVLRSAEGAAQPALRPVSPAGSRVLSDRPRFTWSALKDARWYEVLVSEEGLAPVARSGRVQSVEWTPERPLPRARRLLWQVTAHTAQGDVMAPAPPDPPAAFEIVGQREALEIARAEQARPPSHLLLAVLYARAGLPEMARAEAEALAAENRRSALVEALRRSVEDRR